MASEIDPSVFPDNTKVDKADLREQFEIAANEISELQQRAAVPGMDAFSWDAQDITSLQARTGSNSAALVIVQRKAGVPYQMAFNTALFVSV